MVEDGADGLGFLGWEVADAAALDALAARLDAAGVSVEQGSGALAAQRRHHSFAMVGSGRQGLHHFMVELGMLDDVGQGYDLAGLDEVRVAYTLGRHTNDHMTSFYANTPSGFFVEYGWGGRVIDPATWTPQELRDGPSLWGHERLHLPPEQRARMRELRLAAAARGLRAPIQATVDCPWVDAVIARE
jgi:Glyoxalase/Bleomycin resistance protein/Dioxygenase superfamily